MFIRRIAVLAALSLAVSSSFASGIGGGIAIGGAAGAYTGSVTGAASSISQGNAVAASQVNGNGTSFQHTDGFTAGTATIGGVINPVGAQVITGTSQVAQVNSYGSVTGNTPIEVGGSIYNGTGGLSKTDTSAYGNAAFQTAQLGGFADIGGAIGFGGF